MKFEDKVYKVCKEIPKGKVATYKEVGEALECKGYQAVGQALRKNPYKEVPCHRVVSSDGKLHGFKGSSNKKYLNEKKILLEKEGVKIIDGKVDLSKYLYKFKRRVKHQ